MKKRSWSRALGLVVCWSVLVAPKAVAQLGLHVDGPAHLDVVTAESVEIRASCTAGPNACEDLFLCLNVEGGTCTQLSDGNGYVQELSGYGGTALTFTVTGRGAGGLSQSEARTIFVELGPPLREALRVRDGFVEDFDGTRALVLSDDRRRASIVDLNGQSTEIVRDFPFPLLRGSLGPRVVLIHYSEGNETRVLRWDGVVARIEAGWKSAQSQGTWLAYLERMPPEPNGNVFPKLSLRDLTTGEDVWSFQKESIDFCGACGLFPVTQFMLAPNGDLVFLVGNHINRRHDGQVSVIGTPVNPPNWVVTDGVQVALALPRFSTTVLLAPPNGNETLCEGWEFPICGPVSLTAGWVAYTNFDEPRAPTASRVFRRPPGGTSALLATFPSTLARVGALRDNGDLIVADGTGGRFLYTADGRQLKVLSPTQGEIVHRGGWYVVLGRSVFEVTFSEPPPQDAGVDAGFDDAGVDAGLGDAGDEAGPLDAHAGDAQDAPLDAASDAALEHDAAHQCGDAVCDAGEQDAGVPDDAGERDAVCVDGAVNEHEDGGEPSSGGPEDGDGSMDADEPEGEDVEQSDDEVVGEDAGRGPGRTGSGRWRGHEGCSARRVGPGQHGVWGWLVVLLLMVRRGRRGAAARRAIDSSRRNAT